MPQNLTSVKMSRLRAPGPADFNNTVMCAIFNNRNLPVSSIIEIAHITVFNSYYFNN